MNKERQSELGTARMMSRRSALRRHHGLEFRDRGAERPQVEPPLRIGHGVLGLPQHALGRFEVLQSPACGTPWPRGSSGGRCPRRGRVAGGHGARLPGRRWALAPLLGAGVASGWPCAWSVPPPGPLPGAPWVLDVRQPAATLASAPLAKRGQPLHRSQGGRDAEPRPPSARLIGGIAYAKSVINGLSH